MIAKRDCSFQVRKGALGGLLAFVLLVPLSACSALLPFPTGSGAPDPDASVQAFLDALSSGDTETAAQYVGDLEANPLADVLGESADEGVHATPGIAPQNGVNDVKLETISNEAQEDRRVAVVDADYEVNGAAANTSFTLTLDEEQEDAEWLIDTSLPVLALPKDVSYSVSLNGTELPSSGEMVYLAPGEYELNVSWPDGIIEDIESDLKLAFDEEPAGALDQVFVAEFVDPKEFTITAEGRSMVMDKAREALDECFTEYCTKNGERIEYLDSWGAEMGKAKSDAEPDITFDSDTLIQVGWPATARAWKERGGQYKELLKNPEVDATWRMAFDVDSQGELQISQDGRESIGVGATSLRLDVPDESRTD